MELFAWLLLTLLSNKKFTPTIQTKKGIKVKAGEARFSIHYKMKGVTFNTLDIKISGAYTGDNVAVFEQKGLTPNGEPPLHIHPFQDEWFYVIEGEYLFQVGDDKYELKGGDTIFLPRKIQHAFIQLTEIGKMIVSYLPAGKMESFYKVTNDWKTSPTKEEVIKALCRPRNESRRPSIKG